MSKKKVLTAKHPTYKKVAKLTELADKLKLTLSISGSQCTVTDGDRPGETFYIEDIEADWNAVDSFPHCTETKITTYRDE